MGDKRCHKNSKHSTQLIKNKSREDWDGWAMNIHWSQFKSQLSSKMSCERKKNLKGGEEKKIVKNVVLNCGNFVQIWKSLLHTFSISIQLILSRPRSKHCTDETSSLQKVSSNALLDPNLLCKNYSPCQSLRA